MAELTIGGQKIRSSAKSYGGEKAGRPRALRDMPAPRRAVGSGRPPTGVRPVVRMPTYGPGAKIRAMRSRSYGPRASQGSNVKGVLSGLKRALRLGQ